MALNIETFDSLENLEWLNKAYIEEIINKNSKNKEIKINNIKFEIISGKGENYCAFLTRVHIDYEDESKKHNQPNKLIIKSSFEGDKFLIDLFKGYDIVNKEMNIYNEYLPKYSELLRAINVHDKLFPKTIHVDYKNNSIILEDLSAKSFVMANRREGIDSKHIKLALQKLAKLHATSAVFNSRTNGSLEKFDRGFFNHYTDTFIPCYEMLLTCCSDMVREFGEPFIEYAEKLKKLKPYIKEYGLKIFEVNSNFFNVLIHGDFWINNLMFKYNEDNEPEDMMFIDFQYSCWGSPAIDLHYFLNTSLDENFTFDDQEEFLQCYYHELAKILKAFNFNGKIPTLGEFYIQYISKSFYAVMTSILYHPIILNENTEDVDIYSIIGGDERGMKFKRSLFQNPKIQNILKKKLPIFNRRGLIDLQ